MDIILCNVILVATSTKLNVIQSGMYFLQYIYIYIVHNNLTETP